MTGPVVIKVGGSLLDWPGLAGRLAEYLALRRAEPLVLLAGGGRATDFVRDLDRVHGLTPETAHRLALHSLDLTAQVLTALLPDLVVINRFEEVDLAWKRARIPVFAPRSFLEDVDGLSAEPLPPSWDVTSDSIAARLARHLAAEELALLKSAPIAPGTGLRQAAQLGLVDPFFPHAARELALVTYRNLRDPRAPTIALRD